MGHYLPIVTLSNVYVGHSKHMFIHLNYRLIGPCAIGPPYIKPPIRSPMFTRRNFFYKFEL
jgi:hypothetical protein